MSKFSLWKNLRNHPDTVKAVRYVKKPQFDLSPMASCALNVASDTPANVKAKRKIASKLRRKRHA